MIPFFASKGFLEKQASLPLKETMEYKKQSEYQTRHKVGRLKREVKKHTQNCYKRQHALLKLQELIAWEQERYILPKVKE